MGDVYISQERRLSEEVDPEPDTPQGILNNVNRLERTEVNPMLVRKLNQIARLTESAGRLLRDEYSPSSYVNPNYVLYKMSYTPKNETDFDGSGITFVREPTDLAKMIHGDEDLIYTIPEKDFRDNLLEYINAVYLRQGFRRTLVGLKGRATTGRDLYIDGLLDVPWLEIDNGPRRDVTTESPVGVI